MFTQASNGVVPTNSNVQMKIERTDGGESGSSSESEDSTIADIVEDAESDEDSTSGCLCTHYLMIMMIF